jgi:N-acetylmuramoyl-L-alanine amidase
MSRPRLLAALLSVLPLLALLLPAPAAGQDVEARYHAAVAAFHQLHSQTAPPAGEWRKLAETFRQIHRDVPRHPRGGDSLFSAGLCFREAFQVGASPADLQRAEETFQRFVTEYPRHALADDSLMHLGDIQEQDRADAAAAAEVFRRVVDDYRNGDQAPLARERLRALQRKLAQQEPLPRPDPPARQPVRLQTVAAPVRSAVAAEGRANPDAGPPPVEQVIARQPAMLKRVQFMSALQFTRVILTTNRPVGFHHELEGGKPGGPAVVLLDFDAMQVEPSVAERVQGSDGLLRQARIVRAPDGPVRVALEAGALKTYEVKQYDLPSETKIVIDLYPRPVAKTRPPAVAHGPADARARAKRVPRGPAVPIAPEALQASLRTSLGLKIRSIMLDPGHGGHDPGATAFGLVEKDLALIIAEDLKAVLQREHPDLRVGMTREDDRFVPLGRRPELAKSFGADLFVSIHLNAHTIERFQGVETYFLNLTSDASALQVAARENATSEKRVGDLNGILFDLMRDTNILESSKLAAAMQTSLVEELRGSHQVRDLGVKQAPFMVLIGAEMPSVLVEVGFVTNPEESGRLKDAGYLRSIAEGIHAGLRKYIEDRDVAQRPRPGHLVSQNSR